MRNKKFAVLVQRGSTHALRMMEDEGELLYDRAAGKRYIIDAPPSLGKLSAFGTKKAVYFASETSAMTQYVQAGRTVEVHGSTTNDAGAQQSVVIQKQSYRITPQLLASLLDAQDLKALSLASIPANWFERLICIAAGVGIGYVLRMGFSAAGVP